MINQLRTYRLFAIDTLLPSNQRYSNDMVEKAIAKCKKPFYVHYDVKSFNKATQIPSFDAVCGVTERLYIENGYLHVTFRTANPPMACPDLWDREPNSLSILPIAVGTVDANNSVVELTMYSIAISKTNTNQFSKFIKKSRIIFDPMIRI